MPYNARTMNRRVEDMSNGFVYKIRNPVQRMDDIVEAMLEIMDDDGPKPMRDMKASQKRPNGADQFCHDHQSGYEARGRSADDPVDRVRDHNSACPKLIDELDRRKSICKISPVKAKNFDPKCSACVKLKTLGELKRMKIRPRCKRSDKCNNRLTSKITKSKIRRKRELTNMCSRCTSTSHMQKEKSNETISNLNLESFVKKAGNYDAPFCVNNKYGGEELESITSRTNQWKDEPASQRNPSASEMSSRNPDSDNPSISSYNSYMSMDHEPMVS